MVEKRALERNYIREEIIAYLLYGKSYKPFGMKVTLKRKTSAMPPL